MRNPKTGRDASLEIGIFDGDVILAEKSEDEFAHVTI
jgi:hypothetical protein